VTDKNNQTLIVLKKNNPKQTLNKPKNFLQNKGAVPVMERFVP
jgi:hypothetical protein